MFPTQPLRIEGNARSGLPCIPFCLVAFRRFLEKEKHLLKLTSFIPFFLLTKDAPHVPIHVSRTNIVVKGGREEGSMLSIGCDGRLS
jgi:hypothetical protein